MQKLIVQEHSLTGPESVEGHTSGCMEFEFTGDNAIWLRLFEMPDCVGWSRAKFFCAHEYNPSCVTAQGNAEEGCNLPWLHVWLKKPFHYLHCNTKMISAAMFVVVYIYKIKIQLLDTMMEIVFISIIKTNSKYNWS